MVTGVSADFERGSNGHAVLTSDSGSATPWDTVEALGGTITYDNSHSYGTLAGKFVVGAAATTAVHWSSSIGTLTDHYGRIYLWFGSLPSSFIRWIEFSGTVSGRIGIRATGIINLAGANTIGGGDFTIPIATDQWVRLEWHYVHNVSTGSIEGRLFNNPNSTVPTETVSFGPLDTGSSTTDILIGNGSGSSANDTFWLDNIVAGATSYPGPAPLPDTSQQATQQHGVGMGKW